GIVCDHEGAVVRIVAHVIGDSVELSAHSDGRAAFRNLFAKDFGAVRLGEDRLGDVLADLALIDVPCGDDLNVAGPIAADVRVHEPDRLVRSVSIISEALDERAGAVPDADYGDVDVPH